MSYFKSLPDSARLLDVFKSYPRQCIPLIEYHQRLLREESPFSVGEREWMAAYVSALNSCGYCAGVHEATARRFGVDGKVMRQLLADPETADIPDKMKPVFGYLKKLTECPSRITPEDAEAVPSSDNFVVEVGATSLHCFHGPATPGVSRIFSPLAG